MSRLDQTDEVIHVFIRGEDAMHDDDGSVAISWHCGDQRWDRYLSLARYKHGLARETTGICDQRLQLAATATSLAHHVYHPYSWPL